ncbi:MAG TPA: hypothetical protein VIV14_12460 [Gammaproteobacteria bacterium]
MRLNLTRNAVKRLAIFDHLQRVEIQKIVIFDEGPLQACMNAFVHYEDGVNEERLIEVAAALPVPATVVVMSASSEEVIARSVTRVDKAFKGLLDHHWAAIKSTFESVLPRVIAENTNIDRVVRIASDNPLSAREFWQEVGCLGVSAHTTAK